MRVLQNGFATNFGLVGKSLRRYMTTTALTATGLMALATPALADNWADHQIIEGQTSVDVTVPNTTNITQYTSLVKARGDADITAGHTVNIDMLQGNKSKYVVYDTEADPTYLLGALNANGEVYIFDQNGVIFGEGSQVNVGSIIASTGTISDANLNANKLVFENVGGEGKIVNKGTITVADAGLAAFVAPGVENAGVINAKMGKVALASGNTVTLDLYGDNLVEIAVDGKLENALVKNSGKISAEGGTVVLSAQAAKNAVDDVINMDGVVDVSSVSVKGGKIILGGGNQGTVKVSGKLNADGTSGGSVKVTGQNVAIDENADINVNASNGNGGDVLVYGNDYAIFGGRISGRGFNGGKAEISGGESVGYYGSTDLSATGGLAGTLLIDPKNLTISNSATSVAAILADALSGGTANNVNINAQSLANTLATTNVNLWASQTLSTNGNIDLSTWSILLGLVKGITTNNLNLAAPIVNINGDITLGTGKLTVNDNLAGTSPLGLGIIPAPVDIIVNTLNLNGLIKTRSVVGGATTLAGDSQIDTQADTINVKSPSAKIQQAVSFAQNGATINVAKGTYLESVLVDKSVTLKGAKAGSAGNASGRGTNETIIDPNSPGFHVTADDAVIDGFEITSADDGVFVDGADNVFVKNNYIHDVTGSGVRYEGADGGRVQSNLIVNTGGNGITYKNTTNSKIERNFINNAQEDGVYLKDSDYITVGIYNTGYDRGTNKISNAANNGITVEGGTHNNIYYNTIDHAGRYGVEANGTSDVSIYGNWVRNGVGHTDIGIYAHDGSSNNATNNWVESVIAGIKFEDLVGLDNWIYGNRVKIVTADGVEADTVADLRIEKNRISDGLGDGIYVTKSTGAEILSNDIWNLTGAAHDNASGIYLFKTNDVTVSDNDVDAVNWDGIKVTAGTGNRVIGNRVSNVKREGIFGDVADGIVVLGNTIHDVLNTDFAGVHIQRSKNITVGGFGEDEANTIYNADYGVRVRGLKGGVNKISGNTIYDIDTDGIQGETSTNLLIEGNDIDRTGAHGIDLHDSYGDLNIVGNFVTDAGQNGIDVSDVEDVTIEDNIIDLAGWDGIHVHDFGNADILGNTVSRSGDDGIEAHDGSSVLIDGNQISQSGIGTIIIDEPPEDYEEAYDEFWGGNDGISVRRMRGESGMGYEKYFYGYAPASVRITNNKVTDIPEETKALISGGGISVSGDDGIEVVDVDGYVYIYNNSVENSGTDGETSYGDADMYGADGIHVRNVFANGDIYDVVQEGDVGNGEYNIVVANNTVNNSLDDGIEIIGSNYYGDDKVAVRSTVLPKYEYSYFGSGPTQRVLVQDNNVQNSGWGNPGAGFGQSELGFGGDGIRVTNIYPDVYYDVGEIGEGEFAGYAVDIIRNTVNNSGDDGIEVTNASSALIDDNTVTNSGLTIDLGEGGIVTTNDGYGSDGIFVSNVGGGYLIPVFAKEAFSIFDIGYTPYSVVIRNNDVDNSQDDGIQVNNTMWSEYTAPVLVDSNENVSNSGNHGLYVSGWGHNNVIVSNNAFSNFDIGAEFESGLIDLHSVGNSFTTGRVGLRFAPYMFEGEGSPFFANLELYDDDAPGVDPYVPGVIPTNFGGTIGSQTFTGFLEDGDFYVELANGAFFNPGTPTWLNGLNSTYDGLLPSLTGGLLSEADFNFLETRFWHYPDGLGTDENLGLFWFGFFVPDIADINQKDLFNVFDPFNGDITGLNVRITGLPRLPGQGGGAGGSFAQGLNNIQTFAGGPGTNPNDLNNIETAAGGDEQNGNQSPENLSDIETEAGGNGGEQSSCWSDAMNIAGGGQAVNVVYQGTLDANLNQAASCGTTF